MDVHSRSAFHPLLGRLRIGAPGLWPLSPKLHTSDCSFACPGSSTWVDKVPSRDTPSLNLADRRGGVDPGNPQVARTRSRISGRPYVRCCSGGGSSRAMRRTRVAPDGPAPSLTHRGRDMQQDSAVFVGLDTSKIKISVALAEEGRQGEVRFLGDIDHTPEAVRRLVTKLAGKYGRLLFCYEAGPTGYGLQRQISALGHDCAVIAPSLIPKRPGERVKTNRRDAIPLARLHRAGELTRIWVPDPGHEAVRELVRAREAAMADLRTKRQHLQSFLLRHGRIYSGSRPWTQVHARWLSNLSFEHPAQYLVLREYRQGTDHAEPRLERLTQHVAEVVSSWSMAPVVEAYQASLPSPARCRLSDGGHLRGGDRGCAPFRNPAAAHGLSRPGALGTLNRRAGLARLHHQGWQPTSAEGADRGRLDLPLPSSREPALAGQTGEPADRRPGNRLEGSVASVRALSPPDGGGQTPDRSHHRHCAGDGGLSVGHRSCG